MKWTKCYYGVRHLRGVTFGFQITLTEILGKYVEAEVCLFNLKTRQGFTPVSQFSGTLNRCKAQGEAWAKTLRQLFPYFGV